MANGLSPADRLIILPTYSTEIKIKHPLFLFKLIRLPNLLILFLTQALIRYCIILPAFQVSYNVTGEYPEHLSPLYFSLLCLSTLFIAAGGYIINDIFDQTADEYNRPGKNVIGKKISEKSAYTLSYALFGTAILLGFITAFHIGKPVMGLIQVFSAFSLYMYSSYYQKRILSGNLLIAFLSSLSLLIVGLYEPNFYPNFMYLLWYAGFAFTVSLTRELIKDMEDVQGDEKAQYITFPVRFGIKAGKRTGLVFVLLNILLLSYILITFFYQNNVISFWYLMAMFLIPFLALGYLIQTAEEKKDFTYASLFCKGIMVYGIVSMAGFWYYFLR